MPFLASPGWHVHCLKWSMASLFSNGYTSKGQGYEQAQQKMELDFYNTD